MFQGIVVPVVSRYDDRGVKKATASLTHLGRSIGGFSHLATAAFAAFGATSVAMFGKSSVHAFIANEKAMISLGQTLKNVGAEFAIQETDAFISKLQLANGITKDQLVPAYQQLVTATGDVYGSQKLLNLALNISAGTTKDIGSVSSALSKAYLGNNTALGKLGVSISKTTLATASYSEIVNLLSKTYQGQAAIAAETYAGKIDRIKVASEEAKVVIGEGLVKAFEILSNDGGTSVDSLTKRIENFSTTLSDTLLGVADLTKSTKGYFDSLGYSDRSTIGGKIVGIGSDLLKGQLFFTEAQKKADKTPLAQLSGLAERGKAIRTAIKQVTGGERSFTDDIKSAYLMNTLEKARLANAIRMKKIADAAAKLALSTKAKEVKDNRTILQIIAQQMAKKAGFTVTTDIASINAVAAANLAMKQKAAAVDEASRLAIENNQKALTAYANGADLAIQNAITNANNLTAAFDAANVSASKIASTVDQIAKKLPGGTGGTTTTNTTGTQMITSNPAYVAPPQIDIGSPSPTLASSSINAPSFRAGGTESAVQNIQVTVQGSVVTQQDLVNAIYDGANAKLKQGAKWFVNAGVA